MNIIQTTSRHFRDKQKDFFDLADRGEKVIIRRGKKQAYLLTPVDDEDINFTSEMLDKINRSIKQVQEGMITKVETEEELNQFLESL
jgi:K+/H+ antiporter YhaU regulatory subunit KhtT